MKKSICLLSGGLDSSTTLFVAKSEGYDLYTLSFLYGQKHKRELSCAEELSLIVGAKMHRVVTLPTPTGTSLTGKAVLPTDRTLEEMSVEIPTTYVPARNTLFIAYALQFAEEVDADAIFIGATAQDFSGYPDDRPEYIEAWQKLINLATKKTVSGGTIELKAPLLHLYKAEIVEWGLELGVPYEKTWSCYAGGSKPCLECDSCQLRIKGFKEAGQRDPLVDEITWDRLQKIDNRYRLV